MDRSDPQVPLVVTRKAFSTCHRHPGTAQGAPSPNGPSGCKARHGCHPSGRPLPLSRGSRSPWRRHQPSGAAKSPGCGAWNPRTCRAPSPPPFSCSPAGERQTSAADPDNAAARIRFPVHVKEPTPGLLRSSGKSIHTADAHRTYSQDGSSPAVLAQRNLAPRAATGFSAVYGYARIFLPMR